MFYLAALPEFLFHFSYKNYLLTTKNKEYIGFTTHSVVLAITYSNLVSFFVSPFLFYRGHLNMIEKLLV